MDNENQPDIDGLETEGALARAAGTRSESRDLLLEAQKTGGHLRDVAEIDAARRARILEELGNPVDFAEPGSVSFQLMERIWRLEETEARAILREILAKVAGPRNLRPIIPFLQDIIENRKLEGMSWKNITDNIKLEVPLKGYAITVADMNGYTSCLLKGRDYEKVEAAQSIIVMLNEVAKVTGATLLEPVEGDAGMFLTFSKAQQDHLEAELKRRKVPMRIKKLQQDKHPDGTLKYPMDDEVGSPIFTQSIGVHVIGEEENPQDELRMRAFSGSKGNRGAVRVKGKVRDAAVTYQRKAGPGQVKKEDNAEGRDFELPSWNKEVELPTSNLVAVKLIEALLKMSPDSSAAFKELLNPSKVKGLETVRTAKMNAYYLALEMNPAEENDGEKVDQFWDLLDQEGTGDPRIEMFKPAGSRGLHFWSKGVKDPKIFREAFANFARQMNRFAKKCELTFRLSVGHEEALEYIPLPDSFQVDATGPSIVSTVRGISGLEGKEDGNWISIDRSAVTAMGLVGVEMTTVYIKGTPYQVVQVRLAEDGTWEVRESLMGRDVEEAKVNKFVDSLGSNGVALRLHKPIGTQESGYGESAMVRAAGRYAKSQGVKVISLKNEEGIFDELEAYVGCSMEELMNSPERLSEKVLLTLDEDSLSPDLAARLDRFLFAMAGTKLGLVYTGAYQFRPEALMGDAYSSETVLSMDVELGVLSPEAALDLVFQARPDLENEDRPLIAVLLREWGHELVPRPLIHNFAPALYKHGGRWEFSPALLDQTRAGEVDYSLEEAGLSETERTVLGVIAEVGYPVPLEFIETVLGFESGEALEAVQTLCKPYKSRTDEDLPAFVELVNGAYCLREMSIRQARLLARKHKPAIHAQLHAKAFLREDPEVTDESLDRSDLELEHALAHPESCKSPRTLLLVTRLGHFYLTQKKNFGAAYGIYHRFLEACETHDLDLAGLPADLLHDLVWTMLETSHATDTKRAQALLEVQSTGASPELMWRGGMRLQHLLEAKDIQLPPAEDAYAEVIGEMTAAFTKMDEVGIKLHPKLIKDLKLVHVFSNMAKVASTVYPTEEVLPHAFSGAALSRIACASRQLARLAKIVAKKLPEELSLKQSLTAAADKSNLDTVSRLKALEANLVFLETSTPLDQELKAEILRCLLDACKYLAPSPNEEDMVRIQRYYGHAERSFTKLARPVQSAALDTFDVYANAAVFHWEKKLPLTDVFDGEDESNASKEDKEAIWKVLSEYESKVRARLGHSIRHALMPFRLRLTHQLMNFLQLKMRLLARNFQLGERGLFDQLEVEYKSLAEDSARVSFLLTGEVQDDYYGSECLPIKKAVDRMSAA